MTTACGGAVGLGVVACIGAQGPDPEDVALADVAVEPDPPPEEPPAPAVDISAMSRHVRHRREVREREIGGWPFEAVDRPTEADCQRECYTHLFAHEYTAT